MTSTLAAWLLATASGVAVTAPAEARPTYAVRLPSQPLSESVRSLGRQTGSNVVVDAAIGKMMAPAVEGTMSVPEALRRLTEGQPVTVKAVDARSFVLARDGSRVTRTTGAVAPAVRAAAPLQAAAAPASADPTPRAVTAPEPAAASSPEDIVVTGSRVIQNGNNSPTPVTIVSTQQVLDVQPQTVVAALQVLPQFQGSQGQTSAPGGANANGAAAVINLRNIGNTRTLVLFDGHRLPPTSPTGLVDANMIPQLLLSRVDTVTGGVSAVYGSDAVAGVVNFIPDTKFKGVKLNAQTGVSRYGDDRMVDVGVAAGGFFAGGRGHIEGSYEYYNDPGIFSRFDRSWDGKFYTTAGTGTAANPYVLVQNTRLSGYSRGGLITLQAANATAANAALNNLKIARDGVLSPFVNGTATGTSGLQIGGDGDYYSTESLKSSLRSHQVLARVDYDIADSVHAYVQFSGTKNYNKNNATPNVESALPISASNAFLPTTYQAQLAAAGITRINLNKLLYEIGPVQPTTREKQYYAVGGLTGSFGGGYRFDLSYSHSRAEQNTSQPNDIDNTKLSAALDAVRDTSGNIVCRVTLTKPGLFPGCVPLNLFGPTAANPAALAYVTVPFEYTSVTTMDDVSGSVSGAPISTWAGPINMAISAEYRKLGLYLDSNAQATDITDCADIGTYCYSPTKRWGSGSMQNRAPVSQKVTEFAYEFDAPLLADKRFFKDLRLNGAVRHTYYDTSGGVWTWKAGVDWQVSGELTIRGTRSRDIRAPNLNELYAPLAAGSGVVLDYLTGNNVNATTYTGSNANLRPEVAKTTTAGFVYRPEWAPRLSLAVDAFWVTLDNAITTINGSSATVQQACYNGSSPFYCSLIVRPNGLADKTATNNATTFYNIPINAALLRTNGVDFELNYATSLFSRPTSVRLLTTWQPHLRLVIPGLSSLDSGGAAFGGQGATPGVRVTGFFRVSPFDNLDVTVLERWRSSLRYNADPALVYAQERIAAAAFTNLNFNYALKGGFGTANLFFNIQNLFDKVPPIATVSTIPGATAPFVAGDDLVGRYYTAGVRFRF